MDAREPPWAEHEKLYLLCEILKAAPVNSLALLNLIREAQIQPRWTDMALPPGRSLRSSQTAYENLTATYMGPDYRRPPMSAGAPPIMYSGPEASRKRPFQEAPMPTGRLLQPRPPQTYAGDYVQASGPAYASSMMSTGEPANKKKRGRPTKAEAQQRAQEAAARGEVYPPPRRGRVSIGTAPPEPSPLTSEPQAHERTTPTPAPGSSGHAMTPPRQIQSEIGPESSSGKRRRAKPQPLELEKPHRPMTEMESPVAFGSGDSSRNQAYMSYPPTSAPPPSSTDSRDRDIRMEGVEETQPRTTTPHSFKDTVGI